MTKRAAALLVLLIVSAACKRLSAEDAANARARAIWAKHEAVVEQALHGTFHETEYSEAGRFFRELTGIELHGNGTPFGWMPVRETAADFERIRAWYRANGDRLYADEHDQVRLRPAR